MKKIFTLFVMSVLATTFAWAAQTTTITFADLYGDATVQPATPVTSGPFSFSFAKGNAFTEPAYFVNKTSKEIRLYTRSDGSLSNSMTIKSTTGMIQVVLKGGSKPTALANLTANVGTITVDKTTRTATWTGNTTELVITASATVKSSQYRFATAEITTGAEGEEVIANPTFSRPAGTFYTPFDLAIECTTAGAGIYYTLDGSDPTAASTLYSAPLHITASTTVKAISIKGDLKSPVVTAQYVLGTATDVANIAAYKAVADGTVVKFTNPVNVMAQNGVSTYVKDESGYMYIYGETGQKYKNGDVIPAGFTGKKTTFNGEPELRVYPTDNFQPASSNTPIAPEVIQGVDIAADMFAHYVVVKGVTSFSKAGKTMTDNSGTFSWYTGMGASIPADSTATYDVTGIVGSYRSKTATSTTYQLLPTKFETQGGGSITVPEVANINGLYALAQNTAAKITGNLTAVYQNGTSLYVKDDDGTFGLVFGKLTNTFANGDQIKNAVASWKPYFDIKEIIPVDSYFVKSGTVDPVQPTEISLEEISTENVHYYYRIKGATLVNESTDYYTINDGTTPQLLYNKFKVAMPTTLDVSSKYTVDVFVTIFKKKLELYPVAVTTENAENGDVNGDGIINVSDVTELINMILGTVPQDLTVGDIDKNGTINVSDVTALINIILAH